MNKSTVIFPLLDTESIWAVAITPAAYSLLNIIVFWDVTLGSVVDSTCVFEECVTSVSEDGGGGHQVLLKCYVSTELQNVKSQVCSVHLQL
jgi:Neuraminidase (sialidase)